jgi:hypothetical protein
MARYQVSYDLRKQRNYDELYKALEAYGAIRILESDWLLQSTQTTGQIRDSLARHIDGDDALFVAALTGGAAWQGRLLVSDEAVKNKLA